MEKITIHIIVLSLIVAYLKEINDKSFVIIMLIAMALSFVIYLTSNYLIDIYYIKQRENKKKFLSKVIKGMEINLSIREITKSCPQLYISEDECIFAIYYVQYYMDLEYTVETIFSEEYISQFILSMNCSKQENKFMYDLLKNAKYNLDNIILWKTYADNKTVKRWHHDLISEVDWTFMNFIDEYSNRLAKIPINQYKDILIEIYSTNKDNTK